MATATNRYTVKYERDADGWWVVTVKGVRGVRTQARSISQGRTRIREALALFVDDAQTAELVDDVQIGVEQKRALARARRLQRAAEREQAHAADLARKVARTLVRVKKLSVRDAGEVMGISGARVQQLVND